MDNQNIQIGIDLGTTNSEVAINKDGTIEIVKNVFGDEYTPSVFGIDESNNRIVGKEGYEKLYRHVSDDNIKNFKAEIKRIMGTPEKVNFPRADRSYSPEEISSEILKSLKGDILRRYPDFPTSSAVITTPASFDTTQAEATKRAGNLAGFDYVVLLQEPIAAAIAYGFGKSSNENLLVYDLGGGTFDVALISSKDGLLSVLSHNGDNFLGGKDMDKLIAKEVLAPQIIKKYHLRDFNEGNPKFKKVFAQLKGYAEGAKIKLSQHQSATINIEIYGNGEFKEDIFISSEIKRTDFENLIKPLIDRTIELSKKTILESGINSSAINKVILVGGPTLIPYLRERIQKELKIPFDASVDPLTVVAKGACIYASSQQIPQEFRQVPKHIDPNAKKITLNFSSLTSDTEELVTGIIEDLKDTNEEYFVQIQSENGLFGSPKIKLKNGKFFVTVSIEPKKTNLFWVYLFDAKSNTLPVYPDSFSITHGLSVSGAPIPHSIGVAIAEKELTSGTYKEIFEPIFHKGSILPLKSDPKSYHTIKKIKKGEDNYLPVKIYEGESEIPDRNTFICDVKIKGIDLPYDLPEKTEVELILKVDESRIVEVYVDIPIVDLSLSARGSLLAENLDIPKIEQELAKELERVSHIENDCSIEERARLQEKYKSITDSLKDARHNEDDKRKADKQLRDFKIYLDTLEKEKEMPQLINDFNLKCSDIEKMIYQIGEKEGRSADLQQLDVLKTEGKKAISENDKFVLLRVNEQLLDLGGRIYYSHPMAWAQEFNRIIESNPKYLDEGMARYYIDKGKKAIQMQDFETLRESVVNLYKLVPTEELPDSIGRRISGITR